MIDNDKLDRDILTRMQRGDERAFENIYRKYSPRLYAKLIRLLKSVPQTEEILQDVFIKIWEYRTSIDPEKSFPAFLFKIAENKVYDYFRKAARDQKFQADLIALSTTDDLAIGEFMHGDDKSVLLQNAIALLPIQRQQVFRLIKLERKSYKEVSESLGISLSTISDHVVKATKTIRTQLEKFSGTLLSLQILVGLIYIQSLF